MTYITINSAGNATKFGDINGTGANEGAAVDNLTIGVVALGGDVNTLEYWTINSDTTSTDFGDLTYSATQYVLSYVFCYVL